MSLVTILWSMIAAACLTLAAIYALAWFRNRSVWAHFFFSLTAGSTAAFAFCELAMMRAETPGDILIAHRWAHVPLFVLVVSITWFVWFHLGAGRLWLAWTVCGLRAFSLLMNFVSGGSVNYYSITSVRQTQLLGESVTVFGDGVRNPWQLVAQLAGVLLLVFVADASVSAWRRGDRRKALLVGGSIEFFVVAALGSAATVFWGNSEAPVVVSVPYLGMVAVMAYELSHDLLRSSELVRELQTSEAQTRESEERFRVMYEENQDLAGRLITAQEAERSRIGRDLHDDVCQRLAVVGMMLSGLKQRATASTPPPDLEEFVTTIQERTSTLVSDIRNLSHDLHPGVLEHAGLVPVLKAHCDEFAQQQKLEVTFRADEGVSAVDGAAALCLFRVTQEALTNTGKHAGASAVWVRLTQSAEAIELEVVDNGIGFESGSHAPSGLGLRSINERVRFSKGIVRIESNLGKGTRVLVRVPVPSEGSA